MLPHFKKVKWSCAMPLCIMHGWLSIDKVYLNIYFVDLEDIRSKRIRKSKLYATKLFQATNDDGYGYGYGYVCASEFHYIGVHSLSSFLTLRLILLCIIYWSF